MKRFKVSMPVILSLVGLGVLLAMAVWGVQKAWALGGGAGRMSIHGYIAVALAGGLTLLLGGGLMWLAFYSARHGYDDDQER